MKILAIFKFEPAAPNMSYHVATGWPNAREYVALKCCDRLAGTNHNMRILDLRNGLNSQLKLSLVFVLTVLAVFHFFYEI